MGAGVTVMVVVTGAALLFTALNEAMFPVPLAGRPIEGVLLVQVKLLPVPVKLTAVVAAPLFTVWFGTVFTVGIALTTPVTAMFWFVPPGVLNTTLPDILPAGAVAAERIYKGVLNVTPAASAKETLLP